MGVLVAIFTWLHRADRSPRVSLWLAGWWLMFAHFVVRSGTWSRGWQGDTASLLEQSTLQLVGVAFLVSVAASVGDERRRRRMFLALGIPPVVLVMMMAATVASLIPYAVVFTVLLVLSLYVLFSRNRKASPYVVSVSAVILLAAGWGYYKLFTRGNPHPALFAILFVYFGLAGVLFWRTFRRNSPGVLTTVAGFTAWAGTFAIGAVAPNFALTSADALWNVPKYLVAFGMIVTLLEDQVLRTAAVTDRERELNRRIQQFAEITSRLLSGAEVRSLCAHVAQVITDVTTFQRAVILLTDDGRHLSLAGFAGHTPAEHARVSESLRHMTPEAIAAMCSDDRRVGLASFRVPKSAEHPCAGMRHEGQYAPNPFWNDGDALLIPLRSPRGWLLGCLWLDEPRNVEGVAPSDLSSLEMIAIDIAVAIESASLQRQLVRSEKLATVGQLVSGVAHELNNPLTAVLGYSEVLSDVIKEEQPARDLAVLRREAMRMKRILENLQRFARHDRGEQRSVPLMPMLDDVLRLREYELHNRNIELSLKVTGELPPVWGDDNQLRQVFVSILSNAVDAVENSPEKRIRIEAEADGHVARVRFVDSGPGISDMNRIFDPFFTSKLATRSVGLGLSVCYAILKEHGGDIYAANIEPHGACVTVEIPLALREQPLRAAINGEATAPKPSAHD